MSPSGSMKTSKSLSRKMTESRCGQRRPDVGLFHLGGDVEVLVVPQHLRARAEARPRTAVAFDVDERVGPGRCRPRGLVELAVDGEGARSRDRPHNGGARTAWLRSRAAASAVVRAAETTASSSRTRMAAGGSSIRMCLLCRAVRSHERPAAIGRGKEEEHVGPRQALQVVRLPSGPSTKNASSSASPAVAVVGQNRDAENSLHRPAKSRIHDVRVGDAIFLERLLGAAGDRERAILEGDGRRDLGALDRILNLTFHASRPGGAPSP